MAWTNADGLRVAFGTEEGTAGKAGEYSTLGPRRLIELKFAGTDLTSSPVIWDQFVAVPTGYTVEAIDVIALVAFTSGGSATLDVGLQRLDRSTELDYNGFVAALALTALDTTGETNALIKGSTGAGALIGTVLTNPGYLTLNYNTAAFTAGSGIVRIYISKAV